MTSAADTVNTHTDLYQAYEGRNLYLSDGPKHNQDMWDFAMQGGFKEDPNFHSNVPPWHGESRRGLGVTPGMGEMPLHSEKAEKDYMEGMRGIAQSCNEGLRMSLGVGDRQKDNLSDFNRDHQAAIAKSKPMSKKMVKCSECSVNQDESHYSVNQWTKPAPRCKRCIIKKGFQ